MAGGAEFNSGKFKELVLMLVGRSKDDPLMSRVKLNKQLYRADFEAYRIRGQSISGATYIKGEFGPMAQQLPMAERELGSRGYLEWRSEGAGSYTQKVPVALEEADASQFTPDELAIVEKTLAELLPFGGKSASDWSHQESAGWQAKPLNAEIRYETALIDTTPADEEALAYLRRLENIPA